MKVSLVDTSNKKIKDITLPSEVFEAPVNPQLLAQYIRVYRNNQRQNSNKVLSRSEITGTTAKVWRQKGTGRARHGSRKAPIFIGGGKAHGPSGEQNYKRTLSKNMRRGAILGALSSQVENSIFVQGMDKVDAKTKDLKNTLEALLKWTGDKKVIIVADSAELPLITASKNLPNVCVTQAARLNAYEILTHDHIIFTAPSIDVLKQTFVEKTTKTEDKPTKETKKETK